MQVLDKLASQTSPAQTTTFGQERITIPKQEQMVADQAQKQQSNVLGQLDVDEIILKNINDSDKHINAIFGPLCSIYSSNNSNLVMGSIFNNPYSMQLDTKLSLDKNDIDNMYKNASKNDKEQLKIILKNCFGINNATKYPVVVEYFDVVQFPILMSGNKKLSGSCLNDCLSVLSGKVSKVQEKRLKYSRNIGYGTFGVGTASSLAAVTSFFLVPIPVLQIASLAIMCSMAFYMTATRGKNIYDGIRNKYRGDDIKNIVKKKEEVINYFHKKIKEYLKYKMSKPNEITTQEQKLSNNNVKEQTKEKNATDKGGLKDIPSKVGDLLKQPVEKGNDENNKNRENDKNNKNNDNNTLPSNEDNKDKNVKNDDGGGDESKKSVLPIKSDTDNLKKDAEKDAEDKLLDESKLSNLNDCERKNNAEENKKEDKNKVNKTTNDDTYSKLFSFAKKLEDEKRNIKQNINKEVNISKTNNKDIVDNNELSQDLKGNVSNMNGKKIEELGDNKKLDRKEDINQNVDDKKTSEKKIKRNINNKEEGDLHNNRFLSMNESRNYSSISNRNKINSVKYEREPSKIKSASKINRSLASMRDQKNINNN